MEVGPYLDSHWMLAQYMKDIAQFSSVVQGHIVLNTVSKKGKKEKTKSEIRKIFSKKDIIMVNRDNQF